MIMDGVKRQLLTAADVVRAVYPAVQEGERGGDRLNLRP